MRRPGDDDGGGKENGENRNRGGSSFTGGWLGLRKRKKNCRFSCISLLEWVIYLLLSIRISLRTLKF